MRRRKTNRAHAGGGVIGKEFLAATVLSALLVLLTPLLVRAEKIEQLEARGYVSDFAGVLDPRMAGALTNLCAEVDQKAHAQIAVVTVRSLEDVPEQDFANRLYERWSIGYKGEDRGALILLAVDDRRYWVEVGYGLEPILPDGKVGGFGREMLPLLRQGNYGGALLQMSGRIAEVIAADRGVTLSGQPQLSQRSRARSRGGSSGLIRLIVMVVMMLLLGLGGGRRRRRYGPGLWYMGGGWGGGGGFGGGGAGGGW